MTKKVRVALVASFMAIFGLAFAGPALALFPDPEGTGDASAPGGVGAASVEELGNLDHGECVEGLMDLPAIEACRDAAGRVVMDLPGLDLVGPAKKAHGHPKRLPVTGVNAGDFAAFGGAALAAGAVLLRRVRLALAS